MKKGIHPKNYRPVIFVDAASGARFLLHSTIATSEEEVWEQDGNTYPKATVEISSASHPFYTGKETTVDTTGRVEKFRKRQEAARAARAARR